MLPAPRCAGALRSSPILGTCISDLDLRYRLKSAIAKQSQHSSAPLFSSRINSICLIGLSACALESGDLEGAEAYARRAIALDAGQPIAWNHLCITLNQQDRFQEAAETFQHILGLARSSRDIVDGFTNVGIRLARCGTH
jgi:Flp pilus assembly protein TadD